jgi:hypothetical protein
MDEKGFHNRILFFIILANVFLIVLSGSTLYALFYFEAGILNVITFSLIFLGFFAYANSFFAKIRKPVFNKKYK